MGISLLFIKTSLVKFIYDRLSYRSELTQSLILNKNINIFWVKK